MLLKYTRDTSDKNLSHLTASLSTSVTLFPKDFEDLMVKLEAYKTSVAKLYIFGAKSHDNYSLYDI